MKAKTSVERAVDLVVESDDVPNHYPAITARWLEKARCRGDGPAFIKIGKKVAYRLSAIEAWLDSQTRLSTSDTGAPGNAEAAE